MVPNMTGDLFKNRFQALARDPSEAAPRRTAVHDEPWNVERPGPVIGRRTDWAESLIAPAVKLRERHRVFGAAAGIENPFASGGAATDLLEYESPQVVGMKGVPYLPTLSAETYITQWATAGVSVEPV
jgi:hypothetical protein